VAELSIPQIEALVKTTVSLVACTTKDLTGRQRRQAVEQLRDELLVRVWRGLPGRPRTPDGRVTATDVNTLQVLASVLHHYPLRCPLIRLEEE